MKSRKSAYLNDYTKRIKDLLTTQEEIERYQAFTERLKNLADLTEMHYRSRIPFTAEHRAAFRRTYENALAAAGEVLGRQALGPVALQMRTVARELTPLLQMDLHAIELVEREPDLASRSLPELISRVRTQTADLGSLPWPWGSGQYRRMHKACKALERFTKTLDSKLRNDPDAALSAEDREKLTRQLSELGDRSAAYSAYKRNDLLHNAPGTATEDRQAAAALCASEAARALGYVKEAAEKREKPMYMVQEALREAQAGLSGKDGRSLREQAARILCLNGLTRIGVSQKTGSGVRKALSEASMWNQMQKIMAEPAFQKLAELPDDELRILAAGDRGRALGDQFIRELANRELAAAQQANGPQAAAPEQPQRGPEQQAQPGAEQQPQPGAEQQAQPGAEQQAQPGAEQPVQDGALIQ